MSHTTLNGLPVLSGRITLPRQGLWHADLMVDAPETPKGAVTLQVGAKLTLQGTVLHSNVFAGEVRVRVVAGAGRLATEVEPKWYAGAPRQLPLTDLCDAAGERIAGTTDPAFLNDVLVPGWTRVRGTVASSLARLTEGWSWRLLPDGGLWVGQETWMPASGMADLVVLDEDHQRGRLVLATEAPELLPGQTLQGQRVSDVEITIEPERLRLDAMLDRSAPGLLDRIKGALLSIVEGVVRRRTDTLAWYDGTVVATDAAGRLDVKLDDPRQPTLTGVRIVVGREVKLVDGARVSVGWEAGDPRRPVARPIDAAGLDEERTVAKTKITLHAPQVVLDEETGRDSARQGDLVGVGGPTTTVTFLPLPGAPPVPAMTLGTPYMMLFARLDGTAIPGSTLYGSILTANGKVKS